MTRNRELASSRRTLSCRLRGFRAFRDSGEFGISPLTVIVGRNSSGKSSLLSALLLLKQTFESDAPRSQVLPLELNGPYGDFGDFVDAVHGHDPDSEIVFEFQGTYDWAHAASSSPFRPEPIIQFELPQLTRSRHYHSYYFDGGSRRFKRSVKLTLSFRPAPPFGASLSTLDVMLEGVGHLRVVRAIGSKRRQHWRLYALGGLPKGGIGWIADGPWRMPAFFLKPGLPKEKAAPLNRIVGAYAAFVTALHRWFESSYSIGPFRADPKRRYGFAGFGSPEIGPSGAGAVDLLIAERLLQPKPENRRLARAVEAWLTHLGLAHRLDVDDVSTKAQLYEVLLRSEPETVRSSLIDVGFGISQVLPVIVQGLLAKPGGLYIVQQPELHLHPDAQANLADFFIHLAQTGVSAVVETHSEYFLVRLRRRLAEAEAGLFRPAVEDYRVPARRGLRVSDVSVLMVSQNVDEGATVEPLRLNQSFQFENLPEGFMSQALEDRLAILRALGSSSAS